jgi:hypothetical protein
MYFFNNFNNFNNFNILTTTNQILFYNCNPQCYTSSFWRKTNTTCIEQKWTEATKTLWWRVIITKWTGDSEENLLVYRDDGWTTAEICVR